MLFNRKCSRGQRRDLHPKDLGMTESTATASPIDLDFLIREPADIYHVKARDHLSSHALRDFRRCPLLFRKKELGLITEPDTTAFLVGRAAHVLILEGRERFESEFSVGGPINPKTGNPFGSGTKAFSEWAERLGKPVLSDDQAALVEQMQASVNDHVFARELLAEGIAEGVVRCEYLGHRAQVRLDWLNPVRDRGLVDLKTADRLDGFEFDIDAFGYVDQLAFYRAVVAQKIGVVLPVHIIAVEKREPFRCGVWQIAPSVLDRAQKRNEEAMHELARCRETGIWPTRFESMRLYDRL